MLLKSSKKIGKIAAPILALASFFPSKSEAQVSQSKNNLKDKYGQKMIPIKRGQGKLNESSDSKLDTRNNNDNQETPEFTPVEFTPFDLEITVDSKGDVISGSIVEKNLEKRVSAGNVKEDSQLSKSESNVDLAEHSLTGVVKNSYVAQTDNFIVSSVSPEFSKIVADKSEELLESLAMEWLGYKLKKMDEPCKMHVELHQHAHGETTYSISEGQVGQFKLKIFGTPERILDTTLPHEICHVVIASHFQRSIPNWADEGVASNTEHQSEQDKLDIALFQFLKARPTRGISFNRMVVLDEYPKDFLPLYAQGHDVVKKLLSEGSKKVFIKFIEDGLALEKKVLSLGLPRKRAWDRALSLNYRYKNLSELQVSWEKDLQIRATKLEKVRK